MKDQLFNSTRKNAQLNETKSEPLPPQKTEEPIRVDGFKQVLSLLQVADDAFRESLLRRLGERDPTLVKMLRRELAKSRY